MTVVDDEDVVVVVATMAADGDGGGNSSTTSSIRREEEEEEEEELPTSGEEDVVDDDDPVETEVMVVEDDSVGAGNAATAGAAAGAAVTAISAPTISSITEGQREAVAPSSTTTFSTLDATTTTTTTTATTPTIALPSQMILSLVNDDDDDGSWVEDDDDDDDEDEDVQQQDEEAADDDEEEVGNVNGDNDVSPAAAAVSAAAIAVIDIPTKEASNNLHSVNRSLQLEIEKQRVLQLQDQHPNNNGCCWRNNCSSDDNDEYQEERKKDDDKRRRNEEEEEWNNAKIYRKHRQTDFGDSRRCHDDGISSSTTMKPFQRAELPPRAAVGHNQHPQEQQEWQQRQQPTIALPSNITNTPTTTAAAAAATTTTTTTTTTPTLTRQDRMTQPGAVWITRSGGADIPSNNDIAEDTVDVVGGTEADVAADSVAGVVVTVELSRLQQTTTPIFITPISPDELEAEYRRQHNIIAVPVTSSSTTRTTTRATSMNVFDNKMKINKRCIGITMVVVLVVVVGVVVVVTIMLLTSSNLSGGDIIGPTMSPTTTSAAPTAAPRTIQEQVYDYLIDKTSMLYEEEDETHPLLLSSSSSSSTTPQYKAYEWIVNNLDQIFFQNLNDVILNHHEDNGPYYGILRLQPNSIDELRLLQLYGLATFYYSTTSVSSSWDSNDGWIVFDPKYRQISHGNDDDDVTPSAIYDICNWYGISCSTSYTGNNDITDDPVTNYLIQSLYIRVIHLGMNKLKGGTIPREFVEYVSPYNKLQVLIVNGNHISGTIPSNLFGSQHNTNLIRVDLSNNRIVGTIPTSITLATNLEILKLSVNQLTGIPLPNGMFDSLTKLIEVDISSNNNLASSTIPTSIGNLLRLERFGTFCG